MKKKRIYGTKATHCKLIQIVVRLEGEVFISSLALAIVSTDLYYFIYCGLGPATKETGVNRRAFRFRLF